MAVLPAPSHSLLCQIFWQRGLSRKQKRVLRPTSKTRVFAALEIRTFPRVRSFIFVFPAVPALERKSRRWLSPVSAACYSFWGNRNVPPSVNRSRVQGCALVSVDGARHPALVNLFRTIHSLRHRCTRRRLLSSLCVNIFRSHPFFDSPASIPCAKRCWLSGACNQRSWKR